MQPVLGVVSCTHLTTALRLFGDDLIISSDVWRQPRVAPALAWRRHATQIFSSAVQSAPKNWEGEFAVFCRRLVAMRPWSTLWMRLRSKTWQV